LSAIRAPLATYHNSAAVGAGTAAWLDQVSGAYIGTDGKYALGALQSTTVINLTTSSQGQGSGAGPWPTANVLSLRSLLTRGPASHGRVYWPAGGNAISTTTGVLSGAVVTGVVTAAQTLLNAINVQAALAFGSNAGVGLVSPKGTGFQSPVTRVGVGQKLDHMESRERDLPEQHQFLPLTVSLALLEELDDDFREAMKKEFPNADLP
jgi:hypothetical protein